MMKQTLLALFTLCVCSGNCTAALLFQDQVTINRDPNDFATDQFDLDIILGDDPFFPSAPVVLFDGLTVGPADVGNTFTASLGTDPAFSDAADRLTDGLNEFIQFLATEDLPGGQFEGQVLSELSFFQPVGAPDLAGNLLEAVELKVDGFTFATSPLPGGGQPFEILFTLSFVGVVPEPGLLGFAISALPFLALRMRPQPLPRREV